MPCIERFLKNVCKTMIESPVSDSLFNVVTGLYSFKLYSGDTSTQVLSSEFCNVS